MRPEALIRRPARKSLSSRHAHYTSTHSPMTVTPFAAPAFDAKCGKFLFHQYVIQDFQSRERSTYVRPIVIASTFVFAAKHIIRLPFVASNV